MFEPSERLWQVWDFILNVISTLLPSCWDFSFDLGQEISPHSHSSTPVADVGYLLTDMGYLLTIQCRGHLKQGSEVRRGNKVDTTAQRVALETVTWHLPLTPQRPDLSNYSLIFTKEKLDKAWKWVLVNEHG